MRFWTLWAGDQPAGGQETVHRKRWPVVYEIAAGLLGLGLLIAAPPSRLPAGVPWTFVAFVALSALIKRAGFRVAPPATHSLVGIVDLAALLLFGPMPGGWVAALSDLVYLELHALRCYAPERARRLVERLGGSGLLARPEDRADVREAFVLIPLFSSGLKAIMALAAGFVYDALGGIRAPAALGARDVLPLAGLFVTWFVLDHAAWGLRAFLRSGRPGLYRFVRDVLVTSLLVELLPLPASLVIAAVYAGLGMPVFVLLALALIATADVVQRLADARRRLQSRIAELSILEAYGRAIVRAQFDVAQLCQLAYDYSSRLVDTRNFRLDLVDEARDETRVMVELEDGQAREPRLAPVTAAVRWMRESRQALVVRDLARETLPFQPAPVDRPYRSMVFVPLLTGLKVTGILSVASNEPDAYGQDSLRVLSAIANPLAVAVENARLYDREWQRAIQLSAISEVSRQVAAILDLDDLFGRVVQLVKGSFGYDHVQIFTVDEKTQSAGFRASTGPMSEVWRSRGYRLQLGSEGLIGWVGQHGQPVLVNDVLSDSRYVGDPDGVLAGTRAELAVPLRVEERVVGVLDVQSNRTGAFGRDDLFILQTVADAVAIAIEEARLYQEALQRQRLEEEVRVAREIQASLLPECCPELPGWDISADWRPAREVAGDFFDFLDMPDGRIGVLIADVSDKGIPAALFMTMSRSLVRATIMGKRPPARGLERANTLIIADTRANMFVTLFLAVLDPRTGEVTYVNAGHNPPLVYRAATGSVASLRAGGIALGVVDDAELREEHMTLEPGDVLVMYTDGVTEAMNAAQEEFGTERMAQVVLDAQAECAADIIERLNAAGAEFVGDQPPFDDAALVVVRRLPLREQRDAAGYSSATGPEG